MIVVELHNLVILVIFICAFSTLIRIYVVHFHTRFELQALRSCDGSMLIQEF